MKQAIEGINRVEYTRLSPASLLRLFRSQPGSITRYESFKRLTLDQPFSSIVGNYRKISEGFWCMRFEYAFSKETEVYTRKNHKDAFYELEYFFVPQQDVIQSDGKKRFSLESQAVFSSSAYQKTWRIKEGSKFSSYKFVFTREFLEENFYIDDEVLQDTILQKIIRIQQPYYNREVYSEELRLIRELEKIFSNDQTRLLQTISIKAKVLALFCKFFEIQLQPSNGFERENTFAAAIDLMKQNVEDTFPGLAKLAKVSNVSLPTFKRRFKSLFLDTPEKYFRHLQMEEAERLINKQGMTIREVASFLGYVNPKSFTECFKKIKGYLPSNVKGIIYQSDTEDELSRR